MTSPVTKSIPDSDVEAHALMRQVALRDIQAFETLYQKYTPRLMGFLLPRLDQVQLAEEVCQDVWMVVWKQAAQFKPLAQFSTWLFGIAQRLVWKVRSRRVCAISEVLPISETVTEMENPETHLYRESQHRQVTEAVAALPSTLRQTINLRYYQDSSYGEIAVEMGCAADTVKMRLQQSRRRLAVSLNRVERRLEAAM